MREKGGKMRKKGENHSDPIYTNPIKNLPNIGWKKGKDPHRQDEIQHLDFTKDPGPLYCKTPLCAFYHKNVCSKAVFGP